MRIVSLSSFLLGSVLLAAAADPPVVYLWPNGAPGSEGKTGDEKVQIQAAGDHVISNVHKPSITVYLPAKEKATGVGVVIAPGGGHSTLWVDHEGYNIAQWLQEHGVAGFVLKYRLAREKGSTYTVEGTSLQDTQRAIQLVKSKAGEWGIDPERIGVIGFSAGGELAALAATHVQAAKADATDPLDRFSSKVGFFGLMYPAIPQDMPLSKDMPPAFLVCGENDRQNISQGLPELYIAMKKSRSTGGATCLYEGRARIRRSGDDQRPCGAMAPALLRLDAGPKSLNRKTLKVAIYSWPFAFGSGAGVGMRGSISARVAAL